MNIKEIERGIEKTGFRLEFDISNILEDNGWTVINNKYYVDDLQSTV
jgi:predicted RNA binding protein YcfA (HicA-like mRNA interferase family)